MFISVLERGKLSLHELIYHTYTGNDITNFTTEWYVSKNSDTVTSLKTSELFFYNVSRQIREDDFKDMLADMN